MSKQEDPSAPTTFSVNKEVKHGFRFITITGKLGKRGRRPRKPGKTKGFSYTNLKVDTSRNTTKTPMPPAWLASIVNNTSFLVAIAALFFTLIAPSLLNVWLTLASVFFFTKHLYRIYKEARSLPSGILKASVVISTITLSATLVGLIHPLGSPIFACITSFALECFLSWKPSLSCNLAWRVSGALLLISGLLWLSTLLPLGITLLALGMWAMAEPWLAWTQEQATVPNIPVAQVAKTQKGDDELPVAKYDPTWNKAPQINTNNKGTSNLQP